MNFLKKKLKPLTSGLTANSTSQQKGDKKGGNKDLEDDLYDDYVVEAPPHPSELLALGIDPTDIDVNDPEKLKELYRKAKEEGKDKQTHSILLARQRQKEEIEERKRTREEWKFFDSISARVEQAVKESQKTLEHLKETSAVDKLTQPDYELRLTADEVFKSTSTVKLEKSANNWIDFSEEEEAKKKKEEEAAAAKEKNQDSSASEELDEFGCPKRKTSLGGGFSESQNYIAQELLEDFGIDLRPASQKQKSIKLVAQEGKTEKELAAELVESPKKDIDLKAVARPRPRPNAAAQGRAANSGDPQNSKLTEEEVDPFDTSYAKAVKRASLDTSIDNETIKLEALEEATTTTPRALDPFDTSFVYL